MGDLKVITSEDQLLNEVPPFDDDTDYESIVRAVMATVTQALAYISLGELLGTNVEAEPLKTALRSYTSVLVAVYEGHGYDISALYADLFDTSKDGEPGALHDLVRQGVKERLSDNGLLVV